MRGLGAQKLGAMPRFAALDKAGRAGALVVLLTRLSPAFPFTLLNYALGLTRVRFRTYVSVFWLGHDAGHLALRFYLRSIGAKI